MCDMGEDEAVEDVVLECEKYDRDRMEMMHVIQFEMGRKIIEVVEKTGWEWMVASVLRMIDVLKEFLERIC